MFAQWSNVFSSNKYNVGLIKKEYFIRLSDGTPVKSYTPRCSPAVVEAIESELEKLERAGFIESSNSPYMAPTVCVKKPDGSLRVTINFRMVNKNVINDAYPMHRVEDQLEAMSGSLVLTMLDLTKGYYQMKLAESLKEITALSSPKGLFQWKVLPMGMKTSGAVFNVSWITCLEISSQDVRLYTLTKSLFLAPLLVNILLTWVKYLSVC